MLQLLGKSFILFSIIIIVLYVGNNYFLPSHFYSKTIQDFEKQEDIDIAFFGNSHSHFSYDPRVIELELGKSTINVSGPAQRLVTTEAVVDLVLKKHRLELAVVDIFSLSLQERNNEKYRGFQSQTLDFLPFSFQKYQTIDQIYLDENIIEGIFPIIRNHSDWNHIQHWKTKYTFPTKQDYYKGFASYMVIGDSSSWIAYEKKYSKRKTIVKELTPLQKSRIDAIIHKFKEAHIPLLFLNAPSYGEKISPNIKSITATTKKYITDQGIPFLDLNTVNTEIGLNRSHFRDPNHLNTSGAVLASGYVAKYIQQNFDLIKNKKDISLINNRYHHIETNFKNSLFSEDFKEEDTISTVAISKYHLYRNRTEYLELMIEIENDDWDSEIKAAISFHIDKKKYKKIDKKYAYKGSRLSIYPKFKKNNIIYYNNRKFLVFSFHYPFNTLKDFNLSISDPKLRAIFKNKDISL